MDVSEGTNEPTWGDVRKRIVGLWPKFQPTDEEAALIAQRLSGLRMRWLDAAVESYRCADSSTVFRLATLLDHYQRIASSGSVATAAAAPESASAWRRERARDVEACGAQLRTAGREAIAQAVQRLRATGWLGDRKLPPRTDEWRDDDKLLVCGMLDLLARENG